MARIRRSVQSKVDYLEIWLYVAEQSRNPRAADKLTNTFDQKLELLAEHPGIGTERSELADGIRSFPVGSYLLFYRSIKNGIELVRVMHGSRDLRRHFRRRDGR